MYPASTCSADQYLLPMCLCTYHTLPHPRDSARRIEGGRSREFVRHTTNLARFFTYTEPRTQPRDRECCVWTRTMLHRASQPASQPASVEVVYESIVGCQDRPKDMLQIAYIATVKMRGVNLCTHLHCDTDIPFSKRLI